MENRKSLILHYDSLDVLDELSNDQIANLFIAIRDYNKWNEIKLDWLMKAIFIPFKNQFDRDLEKYENICIRNSLNWAKWWRPKESKETQSVIWEPKKAYNDNDSDNKNNKKKEKKINKIEIIKNISLEEMLEHKNNDLTKVLYKIFMLDNFKQSVDIEKFKELYQYFIEESSHKGLYFRDWEWRWA